MVTVSHEMQGGTIYIYDAGGSMLRQVPVAPGSNSTQLQLDGATTGAYYIHYIDSAGNKSSGKLIRI
jgi:hypothetical protein